MPYIKKESRIKHFPFRAALNVGELNYRICREIQAFLKIRPTSYHNLNSVIGVLECAKLEIYRRIVVPFEEEKIKENGDIF